jgi:hypothetical protein
LVDSWDADGPRLRSNLAKVLRDLRDAALRRDKPTVEMARRWQAETMAGLRAPDSRYIGRFRGERGLEHVRAWVGNAEGALPGDVKAQLATFEQRLQRVVVVLDKRFPGAEELDADGLAAVVDLAAWAHAQWIRIHPFANGNGRTARMWANFLLMRYGLPPIVRLRPQPDAGYGAAGSRAMAGDWEPTAAVLHRMLRELPGAAKTATRRTPKKRIAGKSRPKR